MKSAKALALASLSGPGKDEVKQPYRGMF